MQFKIQRRSIRIEPNRRPYPDSDIDPLDLAFIEDVLGLKAEGDAVFLVRENCYDSAALLCLETKPDKIDGTLAELRTKLAAQDATIMTMATEAGERDAELLRLREAVEAFTREAGEKGNRDRYNISEHNICAHCHHVKALHTRLDNGCDVAGGCSSCTGFLSITDSKRMPKSSPLNDTGYGF